MEENRLVGKVSVFRSAWPRFVFRVFTPHFFSEVRPKHSKDTFLFLYMITRCARLVMSFVLLIRDIKVHGENVVGLALTGRSYKLCLRMWVHGQWRKHYVSIL